MRFAIVTLGCKLNWAEGSAAARALSEAGLLEVPPEAEADVYVVNTCTVTAEASRKSRQAVGRCHRLAPGAPIVCAGCYAALEAEEVSALPGVALVVGRDDKPRLAQLTLDMLRRSGLLPGSPDGGTTNNPGQAAHHASPYTYSSQGRTRCFVKIQDGCDWRCAYCCIPDARGRSRSPSIAEATALCQEAARQGAKELVLTGVNIGHFGHHNGENLAGLLRMLEHELPPSVERLRISSIEPDLLTDELLQVWTTSARLMPHFHLPLQSGSEQMLRLMGRRYTVAHYRDRVWQIRQRLPQAFIACDVIVGCRGETPELFEETVAFVTDLPLSQMHVFSYSERPGTRALALTPVVPPQEKHRRHDILQALSLRKRLDFYRQHLGETHRILIEGGREQGLPAGWTENYIRVGVRGATGLAENMLLNVKLQDVANNGVFVFATPI